MVPALTKILKDGHGIHLSSPPAAVRMNLDGRAMRGTELESPMMSMDNGDLQKLWLTLSRCPSLDSCLPAILLDFPADPLLSPCPQASASQCETVLHPSPASLLSLFSLNGVLRNSHQAACVFPGVPDMFLVPDPEHNSREARLLHGLSGAPACGPDGGDVLHSPLIPTSVSLSCSHGEMDSQVYTPFVAPTPTLTQGKVAAMGRRLPSSVQPRGGTTDPRQLPSRTELEAAVKEQVGRAQRLQRRLQALLGKHALLHCDQQLEGLERYRQLGGASLDSPDSTLTGVPPRRAGSRSHCSWRESSTAECSFTELTEFSRSSHAVLRGIQEALDSEATASSCSDEEEEEEEEQNIPGRTKTSPV
ncbi:KAT8 regulatory NSL complex subunit 1-like protein [Liparis tanakae]|uniref:KAT8 regulatory NSL complex subunit 1-like protein n=1 Tax=Liparis tanakae TaxID=230148 RepID=A0A4Z2IHI1_9TELE|nr:KAT8 regulatory NSL complex subunit 1-like protein [Liparis tanakae]